VKREFDGELAVTCYRFDLMSEMPDFFLVGTIAAAPT
jgi:hypothetical protein